MPHFRLAVAILAAAVVGWSMRDSAKRDFNAETSASGRAEINPQATSSAAPRRPIRISDPHLENVYQLHSKVISGGEPLGEKGFASLVRLGVKTIISVDGARPDVALAQKHAMRYVHLPHSYDGVPEQRAKELAKAVRNLDGPIYIHCHHGKHRSPAAAAVACVGAGYLRAADALAILTAAGTSKSYRGLYKSAEKARRFDDALLDALDVEFRDTVEVPPLADAMVALERTHDHLKRLAAAGWRPIPENPDLDPAHEALLLREHFSELLRTDDVREHSVEFQRQMRAGEATARSLEEVLLQIRERRYPAEKSEAHQSADAALATIDMNCAVCHQTFRDVPLGEK